MVDRFYGFRYELQRPSGSSSNTNTASGSDSNNSNNDDDEFIQAVVDQAGRYGCFGWIQKVAGNKIVGEGRCNKVRGPQFQDWLRNSQPGDASQATFKVYEDTKIRLHFSHFKILDPSRDTCFIDAPHQCIDLFEEPAVEESVATAGGGKASAGVGEAKSSGSGGSTDLGSASTTRKSVQNEL